MNVVRDNISYDDITYNQPEKLHNKYLSNSSYNGQNLVIQIKRVLTPLGIYKDNDKYKIDIIVENEHDIELFNNIQRTSINTLVKNYKKWFAGDEEDDDYEDLDFDMIKNNLHSNIKASNESTLITLPIETVNNIMNIEVYDCNKNQVNWKDIKRDSVISLIMQYNGIRFYKTKFSNDWTINQIKIHENEKYVVDTLEKNVCYIEESDNEASVSSDNEVDIEYDDERIYINSFLKKEYRKKVEIENLQKC